MITGHLFTTWIYSIILHYSSNLLCVVWQLLLCFPEKFPKNKTLLIIEIIFFVCVNSLNPVYNSASFNPSAYFQFSNITLLATAFALNRNFPLWFIYIQETIQVTQCKYFWIIGDVIVQNHIHSISSIPRMNLLGMGCWEKSSCSHSFHI